MEPAAGPQIALRVDFRVRHVRFKSNAYRRRNCDFPKVGTENGSKMAAGAPFLPYVPYDRPLATCHVMHLEVDVRQRCVA